MEILNQGTKHGLYADQRLLMFVEQSCTYQLIVAVPPPKRTL